MCSRLIEGDSVLIKVLKCRKRIRRENNNERIYAIWGILQESIPLPDPWRRPFERMAPLWSRNHWSSCQSVAESTVKVYRENGEHFPHQLWMLRLLSLSGLTAAAWCSLIFDDFVYSLISESNCYFPETLKHRLKYMWLCVCENIFHLVNGMVWYTRV